MVRFTLLILVLLTALSIKLLGQERAYELDFYPDLWYNDADGMRIGLRLLGDMAGTFHNGPHRLDAGIWIASKWPEMPISYYFSLTEPLPGMDELGNEGSVQMVSSIREGYSSHSIRFNKRWQRGFNEFDHSRLSVFASQEKLTDLQYRPFDQLWQQNWKTLFGASFSISRDALRRTHRSEITLMQNVNNASGSFSVVQTNSRHRFDLGDYSDVRVRVFGGFVSSGAAPEYRYLTSVPSAQYWLDSGFSRSQGTIPAQLLSDGWVHFSGGANMRGYLERDMRELSAGADPSLRSIVSINTEFRFMNGVDKWIDGLSIVGDLIDLRTYIFAELATSIIEETGNRILFGEMESVFADGGLGMEISVNIPDYLGRNRGIFIRYDVPLWLSDPLPGEQAFKYRQLIGIGATISL